MIPTEDGSLSVFDSVSNASFHSRHGANTESQHIFIREGLDHFLAKHKLNRIQVFEMGFGTGLNALLSLEWARKNNIRLDYTCIEKYPIEQSIAESFFSGLERQDTELKALFLRMHTSSAFGHDGREFTFNFQKVIGDLLEVEIAPKRYHVVFYDAFGPGTQPELWERASLSKMYDTLGTNGILTTFCAQGAFKRTLKSLGFLVESLPGPPGKREMTRATKVE